MRTADVQSNFGRIFRAAERRQHGAPGFSLGLELRVLRAKNSKPAPGVA
jgi:hypothetical protein